MDILVNNAGFATQGRFEAIPSERDHEQIMVNVAAVVDLAHALLPGMVAAIGTTAIRQKARGAAILALKPRPLARSAIGCRRR